MLYQYIHFTMQELAQLKFLAEAFRCHVYHFQFFSGPSSIEIDAHGIEKLLLKTQVS